MFTKSLNMKWYMMSKDVITGRGPAPRLALPYRDYQLEGSYTSEVSQQEVRKWGFHKVFYPTVIFYQLSGHLVVKFQAFLLSVCADTSALAASGQFSREHVVRALHSTLFLLPEKTGVRAIWVQQQFAH